MPGRVRITDRGVAPSSILQTGKEPSLKMRTFIARVRRCGDGVLATLSLLAAVGVACSA